MSSKAADWKQKYLDALDAQEKSERKLRQISDLQQRGLLRLSLIAEGVDTELDRQLASLRKVLREANTSSRDLNLVVDALESQVKRMDIVRSERSAIVESAFKDLLLQLKEGSLQREDKSALKKFSKQLARRSQQIPQYPSLVKDFSKLQQQILHKQPQADAGPGWLASLFAKKAAPASDHSSVDLVSQTSADSAEPVANHEIPVEEPDNAALADVEAAGGKEIPVVAADREPQPLVIEGIDTPPSLATPSPATTQPVPAAQTEPDQPDTAPVVEPPELAQVALAQRAMIGEPDQIDDRSAEQEPPFSRLSEAIRSILNELLQQLEPPALAAENHRAAQSLIERGLNWYELVPTLENISLVVLASLNQHQQEYGEFLQQLNQRLSAAQSALSDAGDLQQQQRTAGQELVQSMREEVSGLQQEVAAADELGQLKQQVTSRLDRILTAVDRHQTQQAEQQQSLSQQLDSLVNRVRDMEQQSAEAEQRIEQQRQLALRDVLTQLPNREGYQQRMAQEYQRWQRYQRPLSLVVCDVDHFKSINDNYGHLAGDKVLRIIAKTLAKRLRNTDYVARYGGEEFVIVMPETDATQAMAVAETVRQAIASCPFHFREQPVSITMSFGVAEFAAAETPETVFARADKALYQAKDEGRNRCLPAL